MSVLDSAKQKYLLVGQHCCLKRIRNVFTDSETTVYNRSVMMHQLCPARNSIGDYSRSDKNEGVGDNNQEEANRPQYSASTQLYWGSAFAHAFKLHGELKDVLCTK